MAGNRWGTAIRGGQSLRLGGRHAAELVIAGTFKENAAKQTGQAMGIAGNKKTTGKPPQVGGKPDL